MNRNLTCVLLCAVCAAASMAGADVYRLSAGGGVIHVAQGYDANAVIQEPRGDANNFWVASKDGDIHYYWPSTGSPSTPSHFYHRQTSSGTVWTQLIPNGTTTNQTWVGGAPNAGVKQVYWNSGPTEWTPPVANTGTYIALADNYGVAGHNFIAAKQGGGLYNIFGSGSSWYENEILAPSEGEFNVVASWEPNILYAAKSDGSGIWRISLSGGVSTNFVETSDGHVYTDIIANGNASGNLGTNFLASPADGGIKNFYLASNPLVFQSDDMFTDTIYGSLANDIGAYNTFFAASTDPTEGVRQISYSGGWNQGSVLMEGVFTLGDYNTAGTVIAASVPEPATIGLVLLGVGMLLRRGRA